MSRRRAALSSPLTMRAMPTFVDALAAMLLVLVFIITLLSIHSGRVLDELDGRKKAREAQSQLDDDFALVVAAQGMRIEQVGTEVRILLPEKLLFPSGEAEISPEGSELLRRLGLQLHGMTGGPIFVEGHTDDRAIHGALAERFPSNWELSTARATGVVRSFIDDCGIAPERLTASGLGDTRPVASNETEEGRSMNRRIEIRLVP